jgi:hypothetical protein
LEHTDVGLQSTRQLAHPSLVKEGEGQIDEVAVHGLTECSQGALGDAFKKDNAPKTEYGLGQQQATQGQGNGVNARGIILRGIYQVTQKGRKRQVAPRGEQKEEHT